MIKPQRWYEVIDGLAYVYNAPIADTATSMSIVPVEQVKYYRNQFTLRKIWE